MQKNILLISDGGGFMIDALANNIIKKNAGFSVKQLQAEIDIIKNSLDSAEIILLYCGGTVNEASELLEYLKNACSENKKALCVIGYDRELEQVGKYISDEYITRKFLRPFDMRKLAEELEQATSPEAAKPADSKHILLVDDDPSFLKMMQTWLSQCYHVTIVNSGMQAITYIANNTPDLILLDYDMPVTSGAQVLEMIRSEQASADIPVIFLTGRDDRGSVEKVMRLKPQGYLLKSMDKQDIMDAVKNFFLTKEWRSGG